MGFEELMNEALNNDDLFNHSDLVDHNNESPFKAANDGAAAKVEGSSPIVES